MPPLCVLRYYICTFFKSKFGVAKIDNLRCCLCSVGLIQRRPRLSFATYALCEEVRNGLSLANNIIGSNIASQTEVQKKERPPNIPGQPLLPGCGVAFRHTCQTVSESLLWHQSSSFLKSISEKRKLPVSKWTSNNGRDLAKSRTEKKPQMGRSEETVLVVVRCRPLNEKEVRIYPSS